MTDTTVRNVRDSFIPKEKLVEVREFLLNSPPPVFNMSNWLTMPELDNDGSYYPNEDECFSSLQNAINYLIRHTDSTDDTAKNDLNGCGFAACIAGTIQFRTAETEEERAIDTGQYADNWIGWVSMPRQYPRAYGSKKYLINCPLFICPPMYGRSCLEYVTVDDVIAMLNLLIDSPHPAAELMILYVELEFSRMHTNSQVNFSEWYKNNNLAVRKSLKDFTDNLQ